MRVLHFYKNYFPETFGGIEQFIWQLSEATSPLGIDNVILTTHPNPPAASQRIGQSVVHFAKCNAEIASTRFSMQALPHFARLAREADIIHYHYPWPFMDVAHALTAPWRPAKPYLVSYHSDIVKQRRLGQLYAPLRDWFLGGAAALVATSPDYAESSPVLQHFAAQSAKKVQVIPIGLAAAPAVPAATLAAWQAKLPAKFFLFVGVCRYYKGLHYLLQAMRTHNYPLLLVGDGPEAAALQAEAQKLGLTHTQFLGKLPDDDKNALLQLAYACVLPSCARSEAFGISLLEGARAGKPLISTALGTGTSYINVHGETGLVVPPADPAALAAALQQLWENPSQAATFGEAAAARYARLFTAKQMATDFVKLYHELRQELA